MCRGGLGRGEVIGEAGLAGIAGGVGLDDVAGLEVEAGEVAAGMDTGVEADGVADVARESGALWGVAADEDFTEAVGSGIVEALPAEGVGGLLVKGEGGISGGVDEEVGIVFVVREAGMFEEEPVVDGDIVEGGVFAGIGFEGFAAAVADPAAHEAGIGAGVEEEFLVVAEEGDKSAAGLEIDEAGDDAGGVGAAVDVIAEGDDGVGFAEGKRGEDRVESDEMPVNITDYEGAGHGRIIRGGGGKLSTRREGMGGASCGGLS